MKATYEILPLWKDIRPSLLQSAESLLKQAREQRRQILIGMCLFPFLWVGAALWVGQIGLTLTPILGIILLILAGKAAWTRRKQFDDQIWRSAAEHLGLAFEPNGMPALIDEVASVAGWEADTSPIVRHGLSGLHEAVSFVSCQAMIGTGKKIIHDGHILKLRLKKSVSGTLRIRSIIPGSKVLTGWLPSHETSIALEDPEFEAHFAVSGTDQVAARYLLTPSRMEALVRSRKNPLARVPLYLIVDNTLYALLDFGVDTPRGSYLDEVMKLWFGSHNSERLVDLCLHEISILLSVIESWQSELETEPT